MKEAALGVTHHWIFGLEEIELNIIFLAPAQNSSINIICKANQLRVKVNLCS